MPSLFHLQHANGGGNVQLQCAVQTNNPVWKKNRNAYAKLLLNQLKQGRLEKPFNAAPPAGPLQTLPASLTYAFSLPRTNSTRSTVRCRMLPAFYCHTPFHKPCLTVLLMLLLMLLFLLPMLQLLLPQLLLLLLLLLPPPPLLLLLPPLLLTAGSCMLLCH